MKKMYIYDLHTLSLIYDLKPTIEKLYEVIKIDSLNEITDEEGVIEITPLCITNEDHWREIRNFLSRNTRQKVVMLVQDQYKDKVEELIGHHENVRILDRDHVINFEEIMDEIFRQG